MIFERLKKYIIRAFVRSCVFYDCECGVTITSPCAKNNEILCPDCHKTVEAIWGWDLGIRVPENVVFGAQSKPCIDCPVHKNKRGQE